MAIVYNLSPLEAIALFYGGERHGVWNGDFVKNEKKRGISVPRPLREFLESYGYLSINRNESGLRLFHPDKMERVVIETEDEEIRLLVIGETEIEAEVQDAPGGPCGKESGGRAICLIAIRDSLDGFPAAIGEETADGIMWSPLGTALDGIFSILFRSVLYRLSCVYTYGEQEMGAAMKALGIEPQKVALPCGTNSSICHNDETGAFIVIARRGDALSMQIAAKDSPYNDGADKYTSLSDAELENLFAAEFYMNSLRCDFSRALELLNELISRLVESNADELLLAEKYKLAARCLRELGRLDEAEQFYLKGAAAIARNLADIPETAADYFEAMASFYYSANRDEAGEQISATVIQILKAYCPDDCCRIGRFYSAQARRLADRSGNPEEIIGLCNKALEEFQKKPHDSVCKYETARTYQLRGEARRRKKEADKQKAEAEKT